MPIRVRLDRILLDRRMSLTELADRVGVTIANLSILKTGKARAIRFSTLDALCRELDCQPGDLLSFEPGPPANWTTRKRPRGSTRAVLSWTPWLKPSPLQKDHPGLLDRGLHLHHDVVAGVEGPRGEASMPLDGDHRDAGLFGQLWPGSSRAGRGRRGFAGW